MSKFRLVPSVLRAVLSLSVVFLLFQQTGQARQTVDALKYFKNNFVTGDYVVGGVGLRGTGTPKLGSSYATGIINIGGPNGVPEINGMPADILGGYLYWNSLEASDKLQPAAKAGYFNGNKIEGQPVGNQQNLSCEGTPQSWYSRVYRADVLKYLPFVKITDPRTGIVTFKYKANGQHTVDLLDGGTTGILTNGASLVLIYRVIQPGNPRVLPLKSVVIYEGAYTDKKADQNMPGFYQSSATGLSKLTLIAGNGQPNFKQTLNVTDSALKATFKDPFVGAAGSRWDNPTVEFPMKANDNDFSFHVTGNFCNTYAVAVASLQVVDTDFDGILDVLETSGMHFNPGDATHPATFGTCADYPAEKSKCLNFPAMGANPNRPDIFVEMDWMKHGNLATEEHKPKFLALKAAAEALAKPHPPTFPQGIAMHFDVGNNYQGNAFIVPWKDASGNVLAQGGEVIDEATLTCPTAYPDPDGCAFPGQSVLSWKKGFQYVKNGLVIKKNGNFIPVFPTRFNSLRDDTFHYMLLAHALATYEFDTTTNKLKPSNPGKSNSGVGDFGGGDSMLTFGLWTSDDPTANQTGSDIQQVGTILHELGHNLALGHAGDYGIPPCGPGYPSIMNYMYQTKGLTRLPVDPVPPTGAQVGDTNEYVDFSSGLGKQKQLDETSLSKAQNSMGTLAFRIRFYGPAITGEGDTPKRFCDGILNNGSVRPISHAVRLETPSVSVPDWNRKPSDLGPISFDVNFNGTLGDGVVFLVNGAPKNLLPDTNDWASMNLQQVGARRNVGGQSLGVAGLDLGTAGLDLGNAGLDLGTAGLDLGNAGLDLGTGGLDLGNAGLDLGTAGLDLGVAGLDLGTAGLDLGTAGLDLGTAGLDLGTAGLDLGVELDQDTNNSSPEGTLNNLPPSLAVLCADSPTSCVNGSDRIRSTWTLPPPDRKIRHSKVYRFDPDHTTPVQVATLDSKNNQPLPSPISYDNFVNDLVNSGKACGTSTAPATIDRGTHMETTTGVPTCFNTAYTFYIVSENANGEGGSSEASSVATIPHVYVIADDYSGAAASNGHPSVEYGALPIPATTFLVRGQGSLAATPAPECHYTIAPSVPRNVGDYSITCTATMSSTVPVAGVSVQQPYKDGTGAAIVSYVPGKLTITPAPLTITAQANTKTYDGDNKATLAAAGTKATPIVSGVLKYSDSASGLAETYDNANVPGSPHKTLSVSAYTINDGNTGCSFGGPSCNYAIALVTNTDGVIEKATSTTSVTCPATVTFTGSALTPCSATVIGAGGLNAALTVNYANNVNVGTATATGNYGGDDNHFASNDSKNFNITAPILTGQVVRVMPPASVAPNVLESDTQMFFFLERVNLSLAVPGANVSITQPGTYGTTLTAGTVPAGTLVDTYYLHADQAGTTGNVSLNAVITFDTDVLGIQTGGSDGLVSQSGVLGNVGTNYSSAGSSELGNTCGSRERIVLSSDRRTVTVCSTTSDDADDFRIIVRAH